MSVEVPTSEFHTNNLFFAAWLLCGKAPYHQHALGFLRVERKNANSRTKTFIFSDPQEQGPALEEEFRRNPPVRVITLKNAYQFLTDRIKEVDQNQIGGAR